MLDVPTRGTRRTARDRTELEVSEEDFFMVHISAFNKKPRDDGTFWPGDLNKISQPDEVAVPETEIWKTSIRRLLRRQSVGDSSCRSASTRRQIRDLIWSYRKLHPFMLFDEGREVGKGSSSSETASMNKGLSRFRFRSVIRAMMALFRVRLTVMKYNENRTKGQGNENLKKTILYEKDSKRYEKKQKDALNRYLTSRR